MLPQQRPYYIHIIYHLEAGLPMEAVRTSKITFLFFHKTSQKFFLALLSILTLFSDNLYYFSLQEPIKAPLKPNLFPSLPNQAAEGAISAVFGAEAEAKKAPLAAPPLLPSTSQLAPPPLPQIYIAVKLNYNAVKQISPVVKLLLLQRELLVKIGLNI